MTLTYSTRFAILILSLLGFASIGAGFQPLSAAEEHADRNIVFFITDDESPTLGCYGDPVAVTPNIDALASDGVLFRNAFATTASCSASRSVILSGLHNHKNGQFGHAHDFHKFSAFPNVVSLSLPRVLSNQGYRTALIGKYHVAPEVVFKFEQNFGRAHPRNAVQMAENCRKFINDRSDTRPFFLYFGTSDPHRGGGIDKTSKLELKPNRFGNRPPGKLHKGVNEVVYNPADIPIPAFLSDTPETREELAQYYQSCSRIDQGLGRLIAILKEAGVYDKTLIVFTSDHGMAFAGGKTTVYEPGLRVPFVVRNPYNEKRGFESDALISHIDITPSLVDFAGGLDAKINGPKNWVNPNRFWQEQGLFENENRAGLNEFKSWHGKSWLPVVAGKKQQHHDSIFASHTFHEITMYYPMRVVRERRYKLIWNIAHELQYPFASDLWAAPTWQRQYEQGMEAMYGKRTVGAYMHRPEFELYDLDSDPHEAVNLAGDDAHAETLQRLKKKLKAFQKRTKDPWILKWDYE